MYSMLKFIVVAAGCISVVATAVAQELSGTLKKIKDNGAIVIGYREASIPFSFLDDRQQPVGYSIDICMKVVEAVKTELNLPNLQVRFNPINPQTRIPLVANGTVDIECGSTTNTLDRQKQVAFLVTTFVTGTRLLVKKTSGVSGYRDLKGKTLVVTSGTNNERVLQLLNDKESLGIKFVNAPDHAQAFSVVDLGRAVAFTTDDILLYSLKATARNPGDFDVVGEFLSLEPYSMIVRKDDAPFKRLGDRAVTDLFRSGEINKMYEKWFLSPIPPKGVNLNVPMSDLLKELIRNPNDKGV